MVHITQTMHFTVMLISNTQIDRNKAGNKVKMHAFPFDLKPGNLSLYLLTRG